MVLLMDTNTLFSGGLSSVEEPTPPDIPACGAAVVEALTCLTTGITHMGTKPEQWSTVRRCSSYEGNESNPLGPRSVVWSATPAPGWRISYSNHHGVAGKVPSVMSGPTANIRWL